MKKIVIGAIAGALLLTSVSVFADSASLVGKKVQGLFSVEQNGKKIADAVIIDGVAYAPVRAVSEAAGVGLKVEGKKIIMNEETSLDSITAPTNTTTDDAEKQEKLLADIKQKEFNITDLEKSITIYESMAKEMANNGDLGKRAQASADEYKQLVIQRKAELADLQKQLAELQK